MKLRIVFLLLTILVPGIILSGQKAPKKITISGIVLDENNRPVTDAFVTVDGKLSSNKTDLKGFYKVKVLPTVNKIGIYTLFSGSFDELINGRTTINFSVKLTDSQKEGVAQEAIVDENPNKLKPHSGNTTGNKSFGTYKDIYELIQGELPTVIVRGKTVLVPGSVSILLSTEPLFVVNGIQVTSISDIVPSLVKSIDLLKGSEASIYGMKGANGVILINLNQSDNKDYK